MNHRRRIDYKASAPFFALHLAMLFAFWTGVSWTAAAICAFTYLVRMFAITAGFHRYFSHRTYNTSRAFQFALAWIGTCSVQKGVLWWAAHHRHHHAWSDTGEDTHSPVSGGFWWSHVGWFLCHQFDETRFDLIPDLAPYPELRFLNRWWVLPPAVLACALYGIGVTLNRARPELGTSGAQILVWGFFISTVALYHGTFSVNSVSHLFGSRRFATRDDSRNNFLVALFTLGEGWHNNHHYSPSREKQGIEWWELDLAHCALRGLSYAGLVWDLRMPESRQFPRPLTEPAESLSLRG